MPQDPSTDPDFQKASTADQLAYLRNNDKDFAAASPQDQINYLRSVTSSHIGVNAGGQTSSPGYQYSTGYAGANDAPRDSGGFIDRLTTQAGRAMQNPSNFLPSWTSLLGPLDPTPVMNAYKQWQAARGGAPTEDPAKTLGNMVPAALSALVTHAGDAIPNPVKAAPEAAVTTPSAPVWGQNSAASEMQAIKRMAGESSGNTLHAEKTPAPSNQTQPGTLPHSTSAIDRPPTPEEAANNQRFLDAFKKAQAGRPTPNAETSIPHDIEAAQQKVFFNKETPDIDVGKKVREANPEPTRAEVKAAAQAKDIPAGQTAKAVGPAYGPNTPPMEAAQSSTIDLHGYKPENRTMTVQFKNGNVYELKGVPQEIWNNYKNSESQGSYYQQNLKGRYETRLVGKVGKNK